MTLPTPTRRGQILRWDHDTEKKPKKERCKARVRVKQIILADEETQSDSTSEAETSTMSIEVVRQSRKLMRRWDMEAFEILCKRMSQAFQISSVRENQVRSLMPNNEMETGGMRLIRALDDCKTFL